MFRQTMLVPWVFMLIIYTGLFFGAHAVSDTCTICNCNSTGYVNCGKRQLISVPQNIPSKTTFLSLHHNEIQDIKDGWFANLCNLKELDLSVNEITEIKDGSFANLYNLKELNLYDNQITDISDGSFANLYNLKELYFGGNRITDIKDGSFANLYNLKELSLSYNQITDIKDGSFANLYSLERLNLAGNQITDISDGAFANLYNLTTLYLVGNQITDISDGSFANLYNLKELYLYGNQIQDISDVSFANLYSLEKLKLNRNRITEIKVGWFANLYNLKELDLSSNQIQYIKDGSFANLYSLEKLYLIQNRIRNYDDGAFLFLPSISEILLIRNKDMMCGCHLPALVNYTKNNYNRTLTVTGQCQTDLGKRIPILNYSQCTNYSLFQRNLQCQTCSGMKCNDSEVTNCPGAEPVCRMALSMNGVTMKFERSCSTYRKCVEAMRNNSHTCIKWTDGISCTGCCIRNLCNKNAFIDRNNSFVFHLTFKKPNEYKISDENLSISIEHELSTLTGTFSVEYCGSEETKKVFTIYSDVFSNITRDELWHNVYNIINTSQTLRDFEIQQHNVELIDGRICNGNTTLNNDIFQRPVTKIGSNATIPCHANVATRYCSSRRLTHLEMASSQTKTSLKCSPFTGICQEPDISPCYNIELITQQLKNIKSQGIDQGNIGNISKEVLNVLQKSVYFKHQDIDLAVDILEKMAPLISNVSANITLDNILLGINNIMNTPEKVLAEAEQAHRSVSRLLDIIETIPGKIPQEEQQFTVSYSNLGIGVAKVNKDTFDGLFYGVSYGTNETEAQLYNHSYLDPQQEDIQTFSFISLPKSLPKHLKNVERSALSRIVFFSMRNDKLYRVVQNFSAKGNSTINSYVLAANVLNIPISNLGEPVKISFNLINQNASNLQCVYWDESPGLSPRWSPNGCRITKHESGKEVVCSCDHLTSFALLMDVHRNEDYVKHVKPLSIISLIGCGISFVLLVITVIIHVCFRHLRDLMTSKNVISLCISLAVTNLIFLVGMQSYIEILAVCKTVAALLHYFLLTSLVWMSFEPIYVFASMVDAFTTYRASFMKWSSILAWGLPAIIVLLTLVINRTDNYIRIEQFCWLTEPYFYATFSAPVVIILILNLKIFSPIIRRLTSMQNNRKFERRRKVRVFGIVGLFFLLVLTWVLVFFAVAVFEAAEVFKYLLAIFNTLQGMFIFIFYCICKKDTRDVIIKYATTRKRATFPVGRSRSSGNEIEDRRAETNF